ncbi:MAG: hypothetical protein WA477_06440 [Candidatus Sulfotelmatobacter sp.]
MNLSSEFPQGASSQPEGTPVDPRVLPTPDYGTLGLGSDVANLGQGTSPIPARKTPAPIVQLLAAGIGMFVAIAAGTLSHSHRTVTRSAKTNQPISGTTSGPIDGMRSQKQAETLLEQAVGHSPGAVEQISAEVDRWEGQVQWTSQIANLTTAALNSNDMRVRESGVEVELAAYGLSKNSQSLEYLLKTAESPDHAQKIWAAVGARTDGKPRRGNGPGGGSAQGPPARLGRGFTAMGSGGSCAVGLGCGHRHAAEDHA